MSHENNPSSPLTAFERTLARFSPTSPQLDRDRLMFLAGQASVERSAALSTCERTEEGTRDVERDTQYSVLSTQHSSSSRDSHRQHTVGRLGRWLWPASTAALAATSLALAVALVRQPEPRSVIVERHVAPSPPGAISPAKAPNESIQRPVSEKREFIASRIPAENYLRTREVALRMGLDAIGRQPSGSGQPAPTYGDLLLDLSGMKRPVSGDKPASSLPFNM